LALLKQFHPDKSVIESANAEAFINYLRAEDLELNEMIYRTVKAIKLLNFAIYVMKAERIGGQQ